MPRPQSFLVFDVLLGMFCFFLLTFNFSPAFTICESSVLHEGQYLLEQQTLRTSLEKVAETVYQSSSGICSRGGFKHSMWKPNSHSSHKIILSQFCLPAHTLHPHSRHSLFRSSLHFLQWYGYFPYFWKVKSEFLVEFLQCILRCLCVRGLSLCSANRVGVSILIHSWINLILQSIILSSPMQILPIMSTLSTLSKWRSYLN